MREIIDHKVIPANETLKIVATDEIGHNGAHHRYEITGHDALKNPSYDGRDTVLKMPILFQQGAVEDVGVNGVTTEGLLAIIVDRLRAIQKGPEASRENALVLTKLDEAQHWLIHQDRGARGNAR